MGLDNYVTVKRIKKEDIPHFLEKMLPFYDFDCKNYSKKQEFDFAYFRKYWSFRNEVISRLHLDSEGGIFQLDKEDLKEIINILYRFTSYPYWQENDDCIWEYEEALPNLIHSLICLEWLYSYWEEHPEILIEFIDSY